MTWERITNDDRDRDGGSNRLERIEVPGGWLYRTWVAHRTGLGVAMAFVPAPVGASGGALFEEVDCIECAGRGCVKCDGTGTVTIPGPGYSEEG
jgi:hypothetical protein